MRKTIFILFISGMLCSCANKQDEAVVTALIESNTHLLIENSDMHYGFDRYLESDGRLSTILMREKAEEIEKIINAFLSTVGKLRTDEVLGYTTLTRDKILEEVKSWNEKGKIELINKRNWTNLNGDSLVAINQMLNFENAALSLLHSAYYNNYCGIKILDSVNSIFKISDKDYFILLANLENRIND
ncbi:MAG: hypothetical protein H7X71_06760, partial [Chitinophagales bacterium]|nr:hypothetical protein [Chitinophagales bacterium]